jgi:hypothetical protein
LYGRKIVRGPPVTLIDVPGPFRDELASAHQKAAELEHENRELRDRLAEARRGMPARRKRTWVLIGIALFIATLTADLLAYFFLVLSVVGHMD